MWVARLTIAVGDAFELRKRASKYAQRRENSIICRCSSGGSSPRPSFCFASQISGFMSYSGLRLMTSAPDITVSNMEIPQFFPGKMTPGLDIYTPAPHCLADEIYIPIFGSLYAVTRVQYSSV